MIEAGADAVRRNQTTRRAASGDGEEPVAVFVGAAARRGELDLCPDDVVVVLEVRPGCADHHHRRVDEDACRHDHVVVSTDSGSGEVIGDDRRVVVGDVGVLLRSGGVTEDPEVVVVIGHDAPPLIDGDGGGGGSW